MKKFKLLLIPVLVIMINPELLFGTDNDSTVVIDSIAYRIWTDTTHYSMTQCCIPIYFEYSNITNDTLHLISAGGNITQMSFTSSSGTEFIHNAIAGTTHYNILPNDTLFYSDTVVSGVIEWSPDTYLARGRPDILNSDLPYAEVPVIIQGYINIDNNQNFPNHFKLMQNYPNPFNSSTTIKFELPFAGKWSLIIYDVNGLECELLLESNMPSGIYTYDLKAKDLPSGIYFYKISGNGYSLVKKLLLLK